MKKRITSQGKPSNLACSLADRRRDPRDFQNPWDLHQRSGFTLLEVVIAVLLVGLTLVASLKSLGAVLRTQKFKHNQKHGLLLARDLMEEVIQTHYGDPLDPSGPIGPESGESGASRALFDDVDDYNGWSASPPQKKDGTALSNYPGWNRRVTVEFIDIRTHTSRSTDAGLKMITVEVKSPEGETTELKVTRSQWGLLEREPALDTTFVTGAETELQLGSDTNDRMRSGSVYVNQVNAN